MTERRGWVGVDRRWLSDPDLTDSALRLMLWLDSHEPEYRSSLSIARCAREIGWSRNRVARTLASLEELGLVSTELVPCPDGLERTRMTLHHSRWSEAR